MLALPGSFPPVYHQKRTPSWNSFSPDIFLLTLPVGVWSRMVTVLRETRVFHNNLILWREWAVSLPGNQETHHPSAGNDTGVSSCCPPCPAVLTVGNEYAAIHFFAGLQENSPCARRLRPCLLRVGNSRGVGDQPFPFSCRAGAQTAAVTLLH